MCPIRAGRARDNILIPWRNSDIITDPYLIHFIITIADGIKLARM